MLPILWRAAALDDLDAIVAYIAAENPMAAWGLRNDIVAGILPLSDHPYLYRSGRVDGTREMVAHPNYLVIYRVLSDCVEILAVVHARREYP